MRAASVLVVLVAIASPAVAQTTSAEPPASDNGRYAMTPAPGGFLRLDTRSGATALCQVENGIARCAAAAEERTALQDEVDRLARENEKLKKNTPQNGGLPSADDFNRAMDYAEKFMRRMMRILREDEPAKDRI